MKETATLSAEQEEERQGSVEMGKERQGHVDEEYELMEGHIVLAGTGRERIVVEWLSCL